MLLIIWLIPGNPSWLQSTCLKVLIDILGWVCNDNRSCACHWLFRFNWRSKWVKSHPRVLCMLLQKTTNWHNYSLLQVERDLRRSNTTLPPPPSQLIRQDTIGLFRPLMGTCLSNAPPSFISDWNSSWCNLCLLHLILCISEKSLGFVILKFHHIV